MLDLVPFMVPQCTRAVEAKSVAETTGEEKENLDLRLLLLDIERRLGNGPDGEKLIEEKRKPAPWLTPPPAIANGSMRPLPFIRTSIRSARFLDAEQGRIEGEVGGWSPGFSRNPGNTA